MLENILKMCEEKNCELLYLTEFGSHLYGLDTENSDNDYKGLFLPNMKDCVLNTQSKHIEYSTKKNNINRNIPEDIDCQLWSVQYYLLDLLKIGDTGAIDLFYSYNTKSMLFCHDKLKEIFNNIKYCIDLKNTKSFIGYALGQAKKYGIRGSRLGKLIEVQEYLKNNKDKYDENTKLYEIAANLDRLYHDQSYLFIKDEFLYLIGKQHQRSILVYEFLDRINLHIEQYGHRAELARQNQGIDWKAISHALRCLFEFKELLITGSIVFPLSGENRKLLFDIKKGILNYTEVETIINNEIENVKYLQEDIKLDFNFDFNYVSKFIYNLYF
jgi:hypothetical protein